MPHIYSVLALIAVLTPLIFFSFTKPIAFLEPTISAYIFVFRYAIWLLVVWTVYFSMWVLHQMSGWIVTSSRIYRVSMYYLFPRFTYPVELRIISHVAVNKHVVSEVINTATIKLYSRDPVGRLKHVYTMRNVADPHRIQLLLHVLMKDHERKASPFTNHIDSWDPGVIMDYQN